LIKGGKVLLGRIKSKKKKAKGESNDSQVAIFKGDDFHLGKLIVS